MLNPRLAGRYAKSLIDLAQEQGNLEKVYSDMLLLQNITRSNREFLNFLRSPIISTDKKDKIVTAVLAGKVSPLMAMFIKLLVSKGRESALPEIVPAFIEQYKVMKGIQTVKLTTATPISDSLKNAIVDQVKKSSGITKIDLETSVNARLIGGFVLQAGDRMVDVSVASQLQEVSRQFDNNDFVYNIK